MLSWLLTSKTNMKPSKPAKPWRAARLPPPAHPHKPDAPARYVVDHVDHSPVWQGPIFAQGLLRPKQTRVCRHQGPARQGAPEARESIGYNRCNSHQWRCNGHTGRWNGHGIRCNPHLGLAGTRVQRGFRRTLVCALRLPRKYQKFPWWWGEAPTPWKASGHRPHC